MKVIIKKKNLYTAEAVSEDGSVTVYFSRTNSSWLDYGIGSKSEGDVVEVQTQKSDAGREFITRLTADKFDQMMKIETAYLKNQILIKAAREGA